MLKLSILIISSLFGISFACNNCVSITVSGMTSIDLVACAVSGSACVTFGTTSTYAHYQNSTNTMYLIAHRTSKSCGDPISSYFQYSPQFHSMNYIDTSGYSNLCVITGFSGEVSYYSCANLY